MKKKLSILSVLLTVMMLFTMLPLTAGADSEPPAVLERRNGPLLPDSVENAEFAAQFTFLQLIELNEDGTSKQDEDYNTIGYILFRNGYEEGVGWTTVQDKDLPDGVAYDLKTNTVTLTDFDGSGYLLTANMMGDDFTLVVNGACSLGRIAVWGDGWGASLKIAGSGALTVDENKLFDAAIDFYPEYSPLTFGIDPAVTVKLYGKKNAVSINGTPQTEDLFDLPEGAGAEPTKEVYVRTMTKWLFGYSIDENYNFSHSYTLGTSKDDPDGIYTVQETTYYPDGIENPGIDQVTVTHYFYSEKYDVYCEDHSFGDENGQAERVFDDLAAAKAAGFEQKLDENGEKIYVEMKTGAGSGSSEVVIGPDGKEYATAWTKLPNGEYGDVLADIEPLPGAKDTYLFIVRQDLIDVDTESLERVKEDVTEENQFTYTIPGEAFIYEPAAPVTEPPTTEAPITEPPTTEAPVTEPPTTETPITEPPTTEAPKTEPPTTETPKTDPPATEPIPSETETTAPPATEPFPTIAPEGKEYLIGDVDFDGKIKAGDARAILRHAARLQSLEDLAQKVADADGDGKVKAGDARMVLRAAARIEPLSPDKITIK